MLHARPSTSYPEKEGVETACARHPGALNALLPVGPIGLPVPTLEISACRTGGLATARQKGITAQVDKLYVGTLQEQLVGRAAVRPVRFARTVASHPRPDKADWTLLLP